MARIDIKSAGATLSDGVLQLENGVAMDTTLRNVADQNNTTSPLKLSTTAVQVVSPLRITTDDPSDFYLDCEDGSANNRFSITRNTASQQVNLNFSSNPAGSTTTVGAIRTFTDGVNLGEVVKFREDGQVTFTERVNVEADSLITTQSSSVIAADTTNANLVIAPNGTGALIADIPDGTATGGNARGANSVDLQTSRGAATNVASGQNSTISGGSTNTASSNFSTISGGQSNTASTNTHATVVGGQSNTSSGQYSVSGGVNNVASGNQAVAIGNGNIVQNLSQAYGFGNNSGGNSCTAIGQQNTVTSNNAVAIGIQNTVASERGAAIGETNNISVSGGFAIGSSNVITGSRGFCLGESNNTSSSNGFSIGLSASSYLYGQTSFANGAFLSQAGRSQFSTLVARKSDTLTTSGTTLLSLDGTGVTNLIIPAPNNRMWNVQVSWVAVVTAITGTATGVTVGDTKVSTDLLAVARRSGTTTVSAHTSAATHAIETIAGSLTAANITYSAGASQEMAITFTGPTFAGGGSVTMRVVAAISLTEVGY